MFAESGYNWGLGYHGPKNPTKVRGCVMCMTAAAGMCLSQSPPHPTHNPNCGLCNTAAAGVCGAHGVGVHKALDDYQASLSGEAAKSFEKVRAFVDEELAALPEDAWVKIDIGASEGADKDAGGAATGVPPRTLSVLVARVK
jgi:hypothetical protein